MGKFNADTEVLHDPIEITLDGKEYKIEKVTTDMMDAAMEGTDALKDTENIDVLCRQLAVFIGGKPEDYRGIDVRKVGAVLKYITDEVKNSIDGMKPKNG